ncbi:hypothetical protein JW865_00105 [Candidatus Bathyarchaeota archaeon]|nr:hypothetical protein [Candidatus Bathyarchaeota archaeon]
MTINDESKVIWLTCPDCGSKIGIILSIGKTVTTSIEQKNEEWPPTNIEEKLKTLGVDTSLLNFDETEESQIISPKKFLGDQWGPINDVMRDLNANWIRDGRDSRWEIKKENFE